MLKKIALVLFAIFVIIQFFRIDKTNPEVIIENDFINVVNPPEEIATIIKTSCYDCHSNTSKYPWYSNVAPISWWLKDHINEAREELNFSEWETYNIAKKINILEEAIEEIEEGEMPLYPYKISHSSAKLNVNQIKLLMDFLKNLKINYEEEAQAYLDELNKEEKKGNLRLNNGSKWIANPETITGINNMIAILGNDISFENFCRHLPELGQSGTHCIHAQPQIDWIYPNMFDAIIPFEDLNEAWLSLPFNTSKDELKHINATARKENNNPISRQSVDYYLTPNTIKHINEFYADDFAILGYKKK